MEMGLPFHVVQWTVSDKEFTSRKTLPPGTMDEIDPRHLKCSMLFILLKSL
jgi:hypothetical protein